jgi:hypothetical protein
MFMWGHYESGKKSGQFLPYQKILPLYDVTKNSDKTIILEAGYHLCFW